MSVLKDSTEVPLEYLPRDKWRAKHGCPSSFLLEFDQLSESNPTLTAISLNNGDDDDWETDPDFVNEMSEEQQRWGGARDTGAIEYVICDSFMKVTFEAVFVLKFKMG